MKIVVTGGAGFIGSHVAEHHAKKGNQVVVIDNLSRASLLKKRIKNPDHNWNYLKRFRNVKLVKANANNTKVILNETKNADVIVHCAAQTAVTTSLTSPREDFTNNALTAFNALEAARKNDVGHFIFTSTNKVYGENVNKAGIREFATRYNFTGRHSNGIDESFSIDLCEHSPYGCSKLASDIYTQDYGHIYGIKTGVFRMSCIYGTRQFGVEDQGWVIWFVIASLLGRKITVYGNGKQVRDVLYISDLVDLFDKFLNSSQKSVVLNVGGGSKNTLSLIELLGILERLTGRKIKTDFADWRASDQKVYISDISKARKLLNWSPKVSPQEGVKKIFEWVSANQSLFA